MDEEQIQSRVISAPSSGEAVPSDSPSLTSSQLHEVSEAATTEVQVQVQEPDDDTADRNRQLRRRNNRRNRSLPVNVSVQEPSSADIRDDACIHDLDPRVLRINQLETGPELLSIDNRKSFLQQIDGIPGPMLYGFYTTPTLDVETTWTETHNASIQPNFQTEWVYNLNPGSKLDISYNVKNPDSPPLSLIIAQGEESLLEWIEYPSYPNTTLSWNIVYGSGRIEQEITNSDTYYIAVGNLNSKALEVQLNVTVKALLYNTSEAYFRCSVYDRVCSFSQMLLNKNAVILTSPGPEQVKNDDWYWYITLSYGPRWATFILALGILGVVTLILFKYCKLFQRSRGREAEDDNEEPLLSPKDDDLSSWGSSYDSASNDEEFEEGMQLKEGENTNNPRNLCVICFDSPRDCFFLPCGHCASCFTCGSRIAEEMGICPICRRRMKKVRKIFSV
ncbi:hypothetical protein V2J09_006975 [Rumex salicifolius]